MVRASLDNQTRPVLGGEKPVLAPAATRGVPNFKMLPSLPDPPQFSSQFNSQVPARLSYEQLPPAPAHSGAPSLLRRAVTPPPETQRQMKNAGLGIVLDKRDPVFEGHRYSSVARGSSASILDDLGRLRSELKAEQARVRSQIERQAAVVEHIRHEVDTAVAQQEGAVEELRRYRDEIVKGRQRGTAEHC